MPNAGSLFAALLAVTLIAAGPTRAQAIPSAWQGGDVILRPGPAGAFDETAVKDPSILRFDGRWHLFYTARGKGRYALGHVAAARLEDLNAAPRTHLAQLDDTTGYAAAPQVVFFAPQQRWMLVFQNRDANYQPVYSTTETIERPASWSAPSALVKKDTAAKWIDFWVIADTSSVYLFYTQAHRDVVVRRTSIEDFPEGWGPPRTVLTGVHEAVHVYQVQDQDAYHMIFELNEAGERSFGLAVADRPAGPWRRITDAYATGHMLRYAAGRPVWTEEVSHGEALRIGHNHRPTYDPARPVWLIQGLPRDAHTGPYEELPWVLGLIEGER